MQTRDLYRMLTGAVLAGAVAACSTPGRSSATKATSGVDAVAQRVANGEQQLNATVNSLVSLVDSPQTDMRPQYNKFLDNLKKLESQIEKGRSERAAMRSQADAYFAKWEQDIQNIQNEDIKETATARRDATKVSFQNINSEFAKAKPTFEQFMRDLKDVQKALDYDLTPAGVSAIKPVVAKVQKEAAVVKKSLGSIRAELGRVSAQMAATAPAPQ